MILEIFFLYIYRMSFRIALRKKLLLCSNFRVCESVTHSGISPKASVDWAAVVYVLMYSLAVFWTWHSCTENVLISS